jgi:hypothetical protein
MQLEILKLSLSAQLKLKNPVNIFMDLRKRPITIQTKFKNSIAPIAFRPLNNIPKYAA